MSHKKLTKVRCTAKCFGSCTTEIIRHTENSKFAKIAAVGKCPGKYELRHGRLFVGPAGKKLNEGLLVAGLLRSDCWLTNLIKCMPGEKRLTRSTFETCIEQIFTPEMAQLEHLQIIIALGNQPLRYFVPTARNGVDQLHGSIHRIKNPAKPKTEIDLFTTYPPSQALLDEQINIAFLSDMRLLREYLTHAQLI